ncbi:uncharacterized protein LOC108917953 [Anoplophora glabripennis]|nr:uncharacterized protein LOC108917953 [Anoplophora glabripennis]
METKTWTVVLFIDDKSVEAVPSNWIQGEICHWPSFATDKLLQAIRKCEALNTCWPSHNVRIFRNATFDDYGKARIKAKVAEDTSDLNSDDTEEIKRKRVQKILSSSESDVGDVSFLPSPPKLKKIRRKGTVSEIQASGSATDISENIVAYTDILELDNVEVDGGNKKQNNVCKSCAEKDKQFKVLIEQIHIIRGMTIDILSEVAAIKKEIRKGQVLNDGHESFYKKNNIKLPLTTDEELEILESILLNEDDFQLLVTELAKVGGTTCYNFVKRILSTCLTNDMALKYSWLGRKGKQNFSKSNLSKVIIYAAEKAGVSPSRSATEVAMQTWLKRASDRKNSAINKNN